MVIDRETKMMRHMSQTWPLRKHDTSEDVSWKPVFRQTRRR